MKSVRAMSLMSKILSGFLLLSLQFTTLSAYSVPNENPESLAITTRADAFFSVEKDSSLAHLVPGSTLSASEICVKAYPKGPTSGIVQVLKIVASETTCDDLKSATLVGFLKLQDNDTYEELDLLVEALSNRLSEFAQSKKQISLVATLQPQSSGPAKAIIEQFVVF